jgi:hypothetical protein
VADLTPEDQAKLDKYHEDVFALLEKARAENTPLPMVNPDLPDTDIDPELEWCFPGHAHTHHCMEQVIATRKKADAHPDGKDSPAALKLHKVASDLEKTAHKRVLFRQHHYVDWRGKRRLVYVLWHRGGFQTDVFHTCPKITPTYPDGWTKEDAEAFHAERVAHPGWMAPKMTLHQFKKHQQTRHRDPLEIPKESAPSLPLPPSLR